MRARTLSRNSSRTLRSTIWRMLAEQFWPPFQQAADDGEFDESSSIARIVEHDERALAAHLQADGLHVALGRILQEIAPTSVEPVKETASMSGMAADGLAGGFAKAGQDVEHARGHPASAASSASRSAESGVCSAGFTTAEQPAASAGASFQAAMSSGKFQGRTRPTTPIGSLTMTRERAFGRRRDLAEALVDQLGIPLEEGRHFIADLIEAIGDGLAAVDAFERRQLFGAGAPGRRVSAAPPCALRRRARPAAGVESAPRRLDRASTSAAPQWATVPRSGRWRD